MSDTTLALQNHFLVAMPSLLDFTFSHSVIYVCAHNAEGSMGVVVNRPIVDINLGEVLSQMDMASEIEQVNELPVYLGGPVQPERGFIIHRPNTKWQSTIITSDELGVTSSQDILQAMAEGKGPKEAIVILGYAGWDEGQIEQEIADNYWLTVPADPKILFDTPCELRWQEAVASLGIDASTLMGDAGHA